MGIRLLLLISIILIICQKGCMVLEPLDECQYDVPIEEPKAFLRFYGIKIRPKWIKGKQFDLANQFKSVHFDKGVPNPVPLDLCHVKDWKNIKDFVVDIVGGCFTQLWNGHERCSANSFTNLQLFIELLFTIDKEAVVYNKYEGGGNEWTNKKFDSQYLNQVLKDNNQKFKIECILIILELPGRLQEELKMMKRLATDSTNAATFIAYHNDNADKLESLLKKMNSAPANLRYGHRYTNEAVVKDLLDPMGNKDQELTWKEKQWILPSGKYSEKWCSYPLICEVEDDMVENHFFYSSYSSNGNLDCEQKDDECILDNFQEKKTEVCSNTDGG